MNEKILGAIVLMGSGLALGLIAFISAIRAWRRGEFAYRSTWFPRSEDRIFFRVLTALTMAGGLGLIGVTVFIGLRIIFSSGR